MAHVHTFADASGVQRVTDVPEFCDHPRYHRAAEQDMRERWLPTDTAVRHARALLDAEPAADLACIPMIQPGKDRGIWTVGQDVRTVPGVVFIGINSFDVPHDSPVPSYSWARDAASKLARTHLGDQAGTVAYAVVNRDGHVAVFEDIF